MNIENCLNDIETNLEIINQISRFVIEVCDICEVSEQNLVKDIEKMSVFESEKNAIISILVSKLMKFKSYGELVF